MTFREKAEQLGVELDEKQLSAFDRFYHSLTEKNKVMNLTAVTDYDQVVDKHFSDSLSIAKYINMREICSVIDVGTGAGFPGIPLKAAYRHLHMTLLDSLNKRVQFLNEVITEQMFDYTQAIHDRAEDAGHREEYRERYDLAVSRAVADLAVLSEYCLPFVKVGGIFTAYKSASSEEEIRKAEKAVMVLGGRVENVHTFLLPGTDLMRSLVVIRKQKHTPAKYPRKAGMPGKAPIR